MFPFQAILFYFICRQAEIKKLSIAWTIRYFSKAIQIHNNKHQIGNLFFTGLKPVNILKLGPRAFGLTDCGLIVLEFNSNAVMV